MMKDKYIKPEIKCVEFHVELGFTLSNISQGTDSLGDDQGAPTYNLDPFGAIAGWQKRSHDDWE